MIERWAEWGWWSRFWIGLFAGVGLVWIGALLWSIISLEQTHRREMARAEEDRLRRRYERWQ